MTSLCYNPFAIARAELRTRSGGEPSSLKLFDPVRWFYFKNMDVSYFMDLALLEAKKAKEEGEIPVGAVIVKDDAPIAFGHNKKESKFDISSHAEIEVIKEAGRVLKKTDLSDCSIFVTLEPCLMCGGALKQSRIKSIYYGAKDAQFGFESRYGLFSVKDNYPSPLVYGGIKEKECKKIIDDFFAAKRQ